MVSLRGVSSVASIEAEGGCKSCRGELGGRRGKVRCKVTTSPNNTNASVICKHVASVTLIVIVERTRWVGNNSLV